MASKNENPRWETFVRRPGDLKEGVETPLVLRDLTPGRKKYAMRHVIAFLSRNPDDMPSMDRLRVRTVVGVPLPETWGVTILGDLPLELPGRPYQDFYAALSAAAKVEPESPVKR
ncbi:MAG: phenylphosphate carboxylase subunit gamma [Deltaproteobacteria bacterium]|nr:phenylphosphate carboxylase subunit gamma [Deltaproteobacteria bacterium]